MDKRDRAFYEQVWRQQGLRVAYEYAVDDVLKLRVALAHVTGTAPDSVEHFWPAHCEGCKEAAAL